ncbi:MAG: CpaD family pilus assembly protein [Rhizorhabdus sp.]
MRRTTILVLTIALAGCGSVPTERGLESARQPVVSRDSFTLDLATVPSGLPYAEQDRLDGWLESLGAGQGDRVVLHDPAGEPATLEAVVAVAGRKGLLVGNGPPATPGALAPGTARVILSRSTASVPGCPDWSAKSDVNLNNATYPNYGCAVNGNLAAMVADPEHLLHGAQDGGETLAASAGKAIASYREAPPTGQQGLKQTGASSQGGQQP